MMFMFNFLLIPLSRLYLLELHYKISKKVIIFHYFIYNSNFSLTYNNTNQCPTRKISNLVYHIKQVGVYLWK